jgi:hypothetical protein
VAMNLAEGLPTSELLFMELLRTTVFLDFSDEAGRSFCVQTLSEILINVPCNEEITHNIVSTLYEILKNFEEFLQYFISNKNYDKKYSNYRKIIRGSR